jgi:hypothetical protein
MIRRALTLITTTTLATTLTACTPDSATPTPFTPSPAPTSAPATSVPGQAPEAAGAVAAYRQYIAATDVMAASGGTNVTEVQKYASGVMLAAQLNQAATFRGRKWHSVGRVKVVWAKAMKVGPKTADGRINEIVVQACVDSSQAIALTADGKKVRPANAPTQLVDEMKMLRAKDGWKADYPQSRKAGKC